MDDFGVVIGRFQPFHKGHEHLVQSALDESQHVIIVIGSANIARSAKNPWTAEERVRMIKSTLCAKDKALISFVMADDNPYNDDQWARNLRHKVEDEVLKIGNAACPNVHLFGLRDFSVRLFAHRKDASSFYLDLFPKWDFTEISPVLPNIHGAHIRDDFFRRNMFREEFVSPSVQQIAASSVGLGRIRDEFNYVREYCEQWSESPHPPVFVTADVLLVHDGKVAVIIRGQHPGKTLFALPGGFVNANETVKNAALREANEEIGIAPRQIEAWLTTARVFDHPDRDQRGRMITHVYRFDIPMAVALKAGDDAASVQWVAIDNLHVMQRDFYADHFFILDAMLKDSVEKTRY